jgi:hypothetical protein
MFGTWGWWNWFVLATPVDGGGGGETSNVVLGADLVKLETDQVVVES